MLTILSQSKSTNKKNNSLAIQIEIFVTCYNHMKMKLIFVIN